MDRADCLTSDGRIVTIRPARPEDSTAVLALHDRSSDETRYFRFFSVHPTLSREDAERFVTVDHVDREALVVVDRGEIVGLGGYDRCTDPASAEIAFLVDDTHQRRGIGSLLLEHLCALARAHGIQRLEASVLATNHLMLTVFAKAGFEQTQRLEYGIVDLVLDIDDAGRARPSIERREHVADVAAMRPILEPSRIVCITGPPDQDHVGRSLTTRVASGFGGSVHAINPHGVAIGKASGHRSLDEVPGLVDLALITVGAEQVLEVVATCGAHGVAGCVITAHITDHDELLAVRATARAAGIRLVGPGSGGLVDRHRAIDALVEACPGPAGSVGLLCQSTSVARSLMLALDQRGVGVASVVTVGEKADVSGNDLLQSWSEDPAVRVAVLQLESLGNPHRFARIARAVGRDMPVVLLRTAELHDCMPAVDAPILEQLGLIDVPTMEEAVEVVTMLATGVLPAGPRVSVVAQGRGTGLLAADRLRDAGLDVVDLRSCRPTSRSPRVRDRPLRRAPTIRCASSPGPGTCCRTDLGSAPVPVVVAGTVDHPMDRVARALGRCTSHARWARRPAELAARPDPVERTATRRTIWLERTVAHSGWLGLDGAARILAAYGIHTARPHVVETLVDAGEIATRIGYPVLLDGREAHGAESQGGLDSPAALAAHWDRLLRDHGPAALPMAVTVTGPRSELRARVTAHPQLGPLLTIVPADRGVGEVRRLLPLEADDLDAVVIEALGPESADGERAALRGLVLRLGGLVLDNPELVEVHLDAVDLGSSPASVVGAHVRVVPPPGAWDDEVRHLRRDAP